MPTEKLLSFVPTGQLVCCASNACFARQYGNVNSQVDMVNEQLNNIPELKDGFDAIGFSQGGYSFARTPCPYTCVEPWARSRRTVPSCVRREVQRPPVTQSHHVRVPTYGCLRSIGMPPIRLLVPDREACREEWRVLQVGSRESHPGTPSTHFQRHSIDSTRKAQYFRDPSNLETFLEANHFLTSINNEVAPIDGRNETFARNLASLEHLVLVLFTKDVTVIPKESAWFGSAAEPDESDDSLTVMQQKILGSATSSEETTIIPMRRQPLYLEDWIGLRTLDEQGRVILETCEGEHMQIGDCWKPLVKKFVGSPA